MLRTLAASLLASTALLPIAPAGAQPAPNALPTGGAVVAGRAALSQSGATATITQSSQRAAINWQSFNVGAQATVQFKQPSSSSVTLNRVVGSNPSQIAGRIDANGKLIIVNQDGVTFYRGAQVNAAGLVVSSSNISNQNFMAGKLVFDQPGKATARIDNAGTITIKQAGLAAFVAPQVANSGVITAKLGTVVLAGAVTHTLDMYGDGLVALDVSNEVRQAPGGHTALVTNTGTIIAEGGTVQLTARAADGLVQTLVQAGGTIAAPSAGGRTGMVVLNGIGGSITIAGQVAADGLAAGARGGQVAANASGSVTLASTARVSASGQAGGGIGGHR
ncbi:MAG: filamentous hemagglutinin N-terminal domain-containing protein, partial [Rhodospirillales bacterium]|nr:filamentous hemagglutinin N-terminal domain-containing protein [Rhodospirillales bacterium]